MEHKIYKLQNKINGKIYIGRTKNKLSVRMKSHRRLTSCIYLHRALKKYGEKSFSKEIIYISEDYEDACKQEKEFIIKYNSLVPNGYNLTLGTYGTEIVHESTRKLISIRNQGNHLKSSNKSSSYIGVKRRRDVKKADNFETRINKDKKIYRHYFHSEIEAAESYDKVALYLYGLNCRLNFPEKILEYREIDLKDFFENFCKKFKSTSQYNGVCRSGKRCKLPWRSYVYKNRKYIEVGMYNTEKEAYEARKNYLNNHD